MKALIEAVKKHANENYEAGGWDVIVECWEDKDIAEIIVDCKTEAQAIALIGRIVGVYAERQADAEFHRREALGE